MSNDSETRTLLRDTARRALSDMPASLELGRNGHLPADAVQRTFALASENGWLGICAPESAGGLALGMGAAAVIACEIGRALAPGPLLVNTVILPALAGFASTSSRLDDLLAGVVAGQKRAALGIFDPDGGATTRGLFEYAEGASDLLLLSDLSQGRDITLRRSNDVRLVALDPFDPTCPISGLSDMTATSVWSDELRLRPDEGEMLLGLTSLWIAAELLGVAERAIEISIEYARERQQFGSAIGAYQSVKHRIVDDYVALQSAKAVVDDAAEAWDSATDDRLLRAHAARAIASKAALSATAYCIQVHGAAGFSWEHVAHLYYKRARRLTATLGTAETNRSQTAEHLFRASA